jgi:superfamily II DNA or RNA helicase
MPDALANKLIILDNKKCQISLIDPSLHKKLHNYLSYKQIGVEYTQQFQNGWSGITYLLNKNGTFSSGLYSKVKDWLIRNEVSFIEEDRRASVEINSEINLTNKLQPLGIEPRDYQTEIVETALANRKGIVRAATGSGKTLCTALITAKLNKPTIIYVIGLDLLEQFHQLFSSLFDEPIGYIGNGVCDIHRINIASIWSVSSALKIKKPIASDEEIDNDEAEPTQTQSEKIVEMLQTTKLHIFDESHVVTTDTIKSIFSKIDPEHIYGFSGTPFRDDGSELLINSILGEQIIDVPASRLIAAGHLAQPIIKFVKVPKTYIGSGTSSYQTVYKEYITENIIRNKLIVENTKELLTKKYQVLVLFKHLQHGKNLRELFDEEDIDYEYLSGSDSLETRLEVKENLLTKKSNLVLASSIFDIGVDIPSLSALVLCGSGRSSLRCIQRIGRIIRKYQGKKYAAVVDFYDDVRYLKGHSKIRHKIYASEKGFKIMSLKELMK